MVFVWWGIIQKKGEKELFEIEMTLGTREHRWRRWLFHPSKEHIFLLLKNSPHLCTVLFFLLKTCCFCGIVREWVVSKPKHSEGGIFGRKIKPGSAIRTIPPPPASIPLWGFNRCHLSEREGGRSKREGERVTWLEWTGLLLGCLPAWKMKRISRVAFGKENPFWLKKFVTFFLGKALLLRMKDMFSSFKIHEKR